MTSHLTFVYGDSSTRSYFVSAKDMLEEVEKDMFTIPEGKTFMRVLQRHVQDFVKPILLAM